MWLPRGARTPEPQIKTTVIGKQLKTPKTPPNKEEASFDARSVAQERPQEVRSLR